LVPTFALSKAGLKKVRKWVIHNYVDQTQFLVLISSA
jgi:hypothetical protein